MSYLSLKEINSEINTLALIISAPLDYLPTIGSSEDFARPHIEVNHLGYHFVVVERGEELERKTTENIHELLYWVFESVTFVMSLDYELQNRIENQDSRRIHFKKQEELLELLNPEWSNKIKDESLKILKEHPFDDLAGLRATYCGELRETGLSEKKIDRIAYEKYPLQ